MLRIYNYYTLGEANETMLSHSIPYVDLLSFKDVLYQELGITKNQLEARTNVDFDDFDGEGIVNKLWNFICSKYEACYIIKEESDRYTDSLEPLHQNNYKIWIRSLMQKVIATYPKYKKLFDIYESIENKLMDKLKSIQTSSASGSNSSKNRFNNTPQVYNDDYDADKYTSEYREDSGTNQSSSSSTYESDNLTPIKRLEEIQNIYSNLYEDWSEEFSMLFLSVA